MSFSGQIPSQILRKIRIYPHHIEQGDVVLFAGKGTENLGYTSFSEHDLVSGLWLLAAGFWPLASGHYLYFFKGR